jgi:hypothetical protein
MLQREADLPEEACMVATTHHSIHCPTPIAHALRAVERLFGAVFFTILAPIAVALAIVSGLVLAMGLAALI